MKISKEDAARNKAATAEVVAWLKRAIFSARGGYMPRVVPLFFTCEIPGLGHGVIWENVTDQTIGKCIAFFSSIDCAWEGIRTAERTVERDPGCAAVLHPNRMN